ncbi:MAG: tRNA pseudouridine(13) synthase TruD [Planctomycetaceae bacterium]|nr:tRNA pseudouridine(13) synthase TruD [Planctomycetaceae bacterium]MCA9043073.1 tRNA pseudouridine(13) synthase TruD [Planctomycetaceae bacterium]MCB9953356.1 tRNA pseudouridine(13) synthase TruD [Planctomycetaceae bacterium]
MEQPELELPYYSPTSLRVGGAFKQSPEDFEVEEIPAYLPSGEGEHRYLWIEKTNVAAEQLVRHIAQTLGIRRDDVGVAGLKDRQAVTRQWISVPFAEEQDLEQLSTPNIRVLSESRHRNKLKTGHLKGNKFTLWLRDVSPDAESHLPQLVDFINANGVPNYFGDQRFGRDGETLELGMNLLKGTATPKSIPFSRRKFLLRLALSAVQSQLFNELLAERIRTQSVSDVVEGDVMEVAASGGLFLVDDVEEARQRVASGEILTTGPLFGAKMKFPSGVTRERELAVLEAHGLSLEDFNRFPKLTRGARRSLLIRPHEVVGEYVAAENSVRLSFDLPSGSYATIVLREFTKSPEQGSASC